MVQFVTEHNKFGKKCMYNKTLFEHSPNVHTNLNACKESTVTESNLF